ncbi:hypothetical protein ACHAQH_003650 [Verticillium albo-atrum]
MAETPGGAALPAQFSAAASEKSARSSALASASTPHKLKSCVVCRSRKVRCDKQSPCSNCRRAGIPCTVASDDRPPRWARRLERLTTRPPAVQETDSATGAVMDRLRSLEKMVKELGGQLEQANSSKSEDGLGRSPDGIGDGSQRHASSAASVTSVQPNMGRLVGQEGGRSQYVGSSFWTRVSDELDALKADTQGLAGGDSDISEDETDSPGQTTSTRESERAASERNGLLFGLNLGPSTQDLSQFRPMPSQVPFLVDVFSENVNFCIQIVHLPALKDMIRDMRGKNPASISPSDEALAFAVYYAAVTSMGDEDVASSFGATKAELNYKFRLGLELSLAKADFIRLPSLPLLQAFIIFLCLARRHDSPRYVWMMTGLAVRMALAIGLHRDGTHFAQMSPYEVEIRRRVWWCLGLLDIRASEDQGTDFTIAHGSFDTRMPLNVDDADLQPSMLEAPVEREHDTDASFAVASFRTCRVTRQIMAARTADGAPDVTEQKRLLDAFRADFESWGFSHHIKSLETSAYWVGIMATRLVISKLALFIHLPSLLTIGDAHVSEQIRNDVLVAAIEVAEFNHVLSAEPASKQWKWIIETYTHWHAIVFLLIETTRRPWSAIVERAWVALHSRWLIPAQPKGDKSLRVWIPLRRLMHRARKHRDAELQRLRGDAAAVGELQRRDCNVPVPSSAGPFKEGNSVELFDRHWRELVSEAVVVGSGELPTLELQGAGHWDGTSAQLDAHARSFHVPSQVSGQVPGSVSAYPLHAHDSFGGPNTGVSHEIDLPEDWLRDGSSGLGLTPGSWDLGTFESFGADIDMNGEEDMNWGQWLESAAVMELDHQ